jgi:hypothetical protein
VLTGADTKPPAAGIEMHVNQPHCRSTSQTHIHVHSVNPTPELLAVPDPEDGHAVGEWMRSAGQWARCVYAAQTGAARMAQASA